MKQTDENQIIDHADNMRVAREVVNRQRRKAETPNDPIPHILKIPTKLMDNTDVCVMVEYENNFIRFNEVYNNMTVGFVRLLFDAAVAVAKIVNPFDVRVKFNQCNPDNKVVKILDGVLLDRKFKVYVTPNYETCNMHKLVLTAYSEDAKYRAMKK